ncbi:MAG TPA: CTP synthase [Bacillota bacterium]|jgi:CTP synthase|nr:CTP synthase [Bacillota bacterium]HOA35597.1 CTP synthase [Bacillota bacterium]HOL15423.1 CTP synthase [Bacillota bacterium]HPZ12278.1 CTP synthase [Bacillota bacterium]HQE10565.1 CTP synthase [Bacillota bacterium]
MTKYIFITGGVVSSLGKGITAASLGCLLKNRGLKLTIQKFDPYINYDPGTMGPHQHGEIFVTEDGAETDLDLGHYERFIDENLTRDNNVTTGKIYWSVIESERKGVYRGQTVQVIPHITDEIKSRIQRIAQNSDIDVVITEIGGTVGDIESLPFLEAIRQLRYDLGWENVLFIHVTLVPYLPMSGELKTKPTQHSVKELRSIGIQPDIIICRTEQSLGDDVKRKIALFCNIKPHEVVENLDADSIYKVPLQLQKQGLDRMVVEKLELNCAEAEMSSWEELVSRAGCLKNNEVTVALAGKYVAYPDAYLSVNEALFHAGWENNTAVKIKAIPAEEFETGDPVALLQGIDAVLIPGGFGNRGIEGKIRAARVAREAKIPFLGLCLGMQCAVIEFARHVAGLAGAHSTEFDSETSYPVFDYMPGQDNNTRLGGTLRLGAYPCKVKEGTLAWKAYGVERIMERHRHRFEFNNDYCGKLEAAGMVFSGINEETGLVEIIELPDHPWFVAVLFHPEFKSRPQRAHPLFRDFIAAALRRKKS